MALLPVIDPIERALEHGEVTSMPRPYLGYSELGGPCNRAKWYSFHWVYLRKIPRRVMRIFNRGDLEEARIIADLKDAGVACFRRDEKGVMVDITGAIGEEQEEVIGIAGHVKGHPDGRILGLPGAEKTEHLLEIKTANDKKFKEFKNKGVKIANPTYYGQMQSYMGKLKLTRALFVVTNKNDEKRHWERVKFDPVKFEELENIAFDVLAAEFPPKKIGERTWHECKFCNAYDVCQMGGEIQENCRTCDKCDIENNGIFRCGVTKQVLSVEEQQFGCPEWDLWEALKC